MRSASTYFRGAALVGASMLALVLGLPAVASASSGTGENTPLNLGSTATAHASSGSGSAILRTIIALSIVIAIIYAVARILKKVKGGEQKASGDGLEHLATLPLSAGRSVALVRSGSDVVLVGISEQGVTPIKVYTESEAMANGIVSPVETSGEVAPAIEPGQGFLDLLRRMTVRV